MFLKALEIQGFKSFPEKTVLTFGEEITAIVGPNGSGKSNLSDAIRWVMGEQSTRALRGGKMEDVIFGGTERRRPLGFAEVSLVLDNADRSLRVELDEVMVTRRYYRSGESEYYINRRAVRLKDVNELFMDTGLGREGYSIIGQGKIDEILSVKSADRREVFEEAAGISRFRHRKEESERKLEKTEENLLRINDKIGELELQVEPLRAQSEKAQRFLLLRDEMRGLEISLWLDQLDHLRTAAIRLKGECERAARNREEAGKAVEAVYAQAEALSARMREKEVEAESLRGELALRRTEENELESGVAVLRSNIENNRENASRLKNELEQQQGRKDSLAAQIKEQTDQLAQVRLQITGKEAVLAACGKTLDGLSGNVGRLDAELEDLRRKERMDTASASEARALLSALASAAQELLDRDTALNRELAQAGDTLSALETEAKEAGEALAKARQDRDDLRNIISGHSLRVQTRERKAQEVRDRCRTLELEHHTLQARIHMLSELEESYEGYQKAVKLVMGEADRGRLRGVRGPVASLLRVEDAYTVAIEVALGGAMQNLVVEREEDGKAAISWLKRREGGRATFLPLDAVRPGQLRENGVDRERGFVGLADQLISCDGEYRAVFSHLLGRTVVAENMDCAIAMARKYGHRLRIVTLDGQLLNPGGSMTGGSMSRSAGILSRSNELTRLREQETGVSTALKEAMALRDERDREAAAARYELETAQGQVRCHEDAVLKLEERQESYKTRLEELRSRREEQKRELAQLARRTKQTDADTAAARARIEALEGSAAALRLEAEGKEAGRQTYRDQVRSAEERAAQAREALAGLRAEEQAVQRSLEQLDTLSRDMAGERAERSALLALFGEKNTALLHEIEEKEAALAALRTEQEERQGKIDGLNREKLALEAKRNRANQESREKNDQLLAFEREAAALEQKKNTAELEEKGLLDKLWETYELTHQAALQQRVPLESVPQAQRRVSELKRTITGLGNINLDAIEEFQRVNERYTYLVDQRDDVEKARGELNGVISGITAEMKRVFAQQFALLNTSFGETFRDLFGGGRATLELEDEKDILNCGIEIRVQPPGKTLKVLSLLSGGEKAFVAIALYFAILKVRPTPFCVMDEIEAALDDTNVVRFAQYMRNMSGHTQFIVITHRRGTMEEADVLYGVTMQERGVSRMLTINLNDVEKELGLKA